MSSKYYVGVLSYDLFRYFRLTSELDDIATVLKDSILNETQVVVEGFGEDVDSEIELSMPLTQGGETLEYDQGK